MQGQALQLRLEDQATQTRKSVSYHPSVWGDYFIANGGKASLHNQEASCELVSMRKRAEGLKDQVRRLFKDAAAETDLLQTMSLIDSIQLLGLEYHFEKEIDEALARIQDTKTDDSFGLHETALRFRLLRQQGRYVSSEVFNKFLVEENKFMGCLKDDVRGLLSLYHAAYLGTHDETILDEAKSFARSHLESMLSELESSLANQVCFALETPLYRRARSLMARHYMRIYQESTEANDAILQLAKLDFNLLQSLYREELHIICTWGRDLYAPKHLCFARDRVVECYFWIMLAHPEPQYSLPRLAITKLSCLISILDDTYDAYSTLEEAQLLTDAIQRWDATTIEQLPEYMKYFYLKLTSVVEELEIALAPKDKYRLSYLKKAIEDQAKSYFQECKWAAINYVPSVEEYLSVSMISSVYPMLECASFVGMGDVVTKEKLDWVRSFPPFVKATAVIARVRNDVTSREFEESREHVASTVRCYMKEHQTDMNVACEKLQCVVEDAWKDINEECLKTSFPKVLFEVMVNYTRVIDTIYKHSDDYTNSSYRTKENISLLFVDPIAI